MPTTYSPLRYPGGKTSLYPLVHQIIANNNLVGSTYIEPFAGGAGLALKLLYKQDVKKIILNDLDDAIHTFWSCVLEYPDELCQRIFETPITIDEWKKQKEIYIKKGNGNLIDFAFAALFLNRTNISGIIKGGVIGGAEQEGSYLINARFTRETLIRKIKKIQEHKTEIIIYNLDAKEFIKTVLPKHRKVLINFDPPYVKKGAALYKNSFEKDDHITLYKIINQCRRDWIVTYDDCELIRSLYSKYRMGLIDINYSAGNQKKSKEILISGKNVSIPKSDIYTEIV